MRKAGPALVLGAGVLFSLYLVSLTNEGTFYSGDGGLKFLLTRQFASGVLTPELRLPASGWVDELWRSGVYPFRTPFVYELGGHHYTQYPLLFSFITAPLYAAFGHPGLYVVPMLGLWAIWCTFYVVARRLELGIGGTVAGLLTLIFCSPLTLYGAMYWEHTVGTAIAFIGVAVLLTRWADISPRATVCAGFALGVSACFRSELLCFGAVVTLAWWVVARPPRTVVALALASGFVLGVGTLAAANLATYGTPFGTHALALVRDLSALQRVEAAATVLSRLVSLLVEYFPAVGVAALAPLLVSKRADRLTTARVRFVCCAAALFVAAVPVILPSPALNGAGGKQWGPRFLLVVIPCLSLAVAVLVRCALEAKSAWLRVVAALVFAAVATRGAALNTVRGAAHLRADYAGRIAPALRQVRADPATMVAVTNQYVSQELAATMERKCFFLTRSLGQLEKVAMAAADHGTDELLYLTFPPELIHVDKAVALASGSARLVVAPLSVYGSYGIHHVSIVRGATP